MPFIFDIVVVQAMGDIRFIGNLPSSREKLIICYNESIYNVLLKLYPDQKVVFSAIKYNEIFNFKRVFSALGKVKTLALSIKQYEVANIYVFSNGWDWITPTLSKMIGHTKAFQFLDIYENTTNKQPNTIKAKLKAMYCSWITGVKFEALTKGDAAIVTFHNVQKVKKTKSLKSEVKFISQVKEDNVIIVLDSPSNGILNYIQGMNSITQRLQQFGYKVYLKPHPRLKNEFKYIDLVLPFDIPLEFMEISSCVAVLGVSSAAMYNNNCSKNLSIVNEFDFESEECKEEVIAILKKNKIEILKKLDQWLV